MGQAIAASDLQPGDVLLYHGDSMLSRLIRLFDGGDYSHASIYDGTQITESIETGITTRSVAESVRGVPYVDVYRFQADDGRKMGPNLSPTPVVRRINYYQSHHEDYAYEQLLLLALLTTSRRVPTGIPFLSMIVRNILDAAAAAVDKIITLGKEPMICSEFVYRCYQEAGPDYFIRVVGADVPGAAVANIAAANTPEDAALAASAAAFLRRYAQAKAVSLRKGRRAKSNTAKAPQPSAVVAAVPDFVTPRDLQQTHNLFRVGTLTTPA